MKPLLGITLKVSSTVVLAAMGTLIKLVADTFPTGEIMFFRSFFALVPLLVWLAWEGELPHALTTKNPLGHLRRCLCSSAGMFSGFFALGYLGLADATAIGYVTPLLVTLLAVLVLKEKVRMYRWGALAVGFTGMIIMLSPYFGTGVPGGPGGSQSIGALAALASACLSAVASLEVRRLAQTERTGTIVFYFSVSASVLGLLAGAHAWVTPSPREAVMLVSAGILGGIGQILLTSSYRFAPLSTIAPFDYTALLWTVLLGIVIFGQVPATLVLVGAALVIAAGMVVIWRESVLGIQARKEREAGLHRIN